MLNLFLQGASLHFFPDFRAPIDQATVRLTIPGAGWVAAQAARWRRQQHFLPESINRKGSPT